MLAHEESSVSTDIDLDSQIGRRVHQLMWDRQVTQTAFGNRIGMDQSSVAKRLRGKLGWSAVQLKSAAGALDTTVAYLVGESDEETRPVGPAGIEPTTSTVESGRFAPDWVAPVIPMRRAS